MIKPEDITQQQAERFAELMDADFGRFLNDYQAIPVDKFANALIEAGIVSPPVYAIQHNGVNTFGLFSNENATTFLKSFRHPEKYAVEHWKGQAE
jgi:hypothetical protein